MLGVPRAARERGFETADDALLEAGRKQAPHRLCGADGGVQQCLRPAPERLDEAVGAVARRRDPLDPAAPAERRCDRGRRGEARALDLQRLAQMIVLPRRQGIELEREHHDGPARDPSQLREPGLPRVPVMDRHACHRGVEAVVGERQRLRTRRDRRRRAVGPLGAHGGARLHRDDAAIGGLVRAAARADVDDAARVSEGGVDPFGDPRIAAAVLRIDPSVALVVHAGPGHATSR